MNKEELIIKWKEEIASQSKIYGDHNVQNFLRNQSLGAMTAISLMIEDIKRLNEDTVKRSELIDFVAWFLKHPCNYNTENLAESIVDSYLKKSINSSEA